MSYEQDIFSLPLEMLCGLSTYLPGEELKSFGNTCRRLKVIADKTAIGRIAYLLRKQDPLWARLHKGQCSISKLLEENITVQFFCRTRHIN
jgi:hypothetical protein